MRSALTQLPATTADFKNGMTFEIEGVPHKLLEFLHVKPGKGSAFVRSKVKNMTNGSVQEKTFRAGESVQIAQLDKATMQYTFSEDNNAAFMDMESFEEVRIPRKKIDNVNLLKAGLEVKTLAYNGEIIDIEFPNQLEYEVVEKVSAKECIVDTEEPLSVAVPEFIEVGEKIIVSTDDGKFVSRAKGSGKDFN